MQGKVDWGQFFLSPRGRINRELWWLGVILLVACASIVAGLLGQRNTMTLAIDMILLIPYLCLHIKRCHDREKSGWWCLILFIPFVGFFWAIFDLGLLEGTKGDNRYGPDPLA